MSAPTVLAELPLDMTLDWLQETLDALPRNRTPAVIESNLAFLELGWPEPMIRLLRAILTNGKALDTIADRSYRHVNHFDKIVLVDSGDRLGYRLTLHLWSPPYTEDEVNDELIHDHRFSFWSNILTGNLLSENFVVSEEGHRYHQYQYSPEKRDVSTTSNFYEFIGDTQLLTVAPSKETAGGTYFLSYDRTHRVILPQTSMTCTLVLRGPRERNFSNVFNTSYPSQDARATNEMFTAAQLTRKLTALLDELAKTRLGQR